MEPLKNNELIRKCLWQIIHTRRINLLTYANKPKVNQNYLDRENAFLAELTLLANKMICLRYDDFWQRVEKEWLRMEQVDRQLSGHILRFRIREEGNNFSIITLNRSADDAF